MREGLLGSYHAYVQPLAPVERDQFYAEGAPLAKLYGATSAPESEAAIAALFERMGAQLQCSDIVFEFLAIVRRMSLPPAPLRPLVATHARLLGRTCCRSARLAQPSGGAGVPQARPAG